MAFHMPTRLFRAQIAFERGPRRATKVNFVLNPRSGCGGKI